MKRWKVVLSKSTIWGLLSVGVLLLGSGGAFAQESEDRSLSPYFFVKSEDPSIDRLPLKSTSAAVNIAGVIADVTVTQVYKNEGQKPLEALYVFPASTRAAVYGMKMIIGDRTITAKIERREEARQAYEKAKQEGKSASLLEQHRPNVFQMNVANIMPGDEIRTELRYTELLVPTDGVYAFVYPTVVGPRYANQPAAPASEKWSQNPYLHQGEPPTTAFDIQVNLAAGLPIQEMTCASHRVNIRYEGKERARVALDPAEGSGGNRDFILKYRLAGERVESGLLLYEGGEENFFLLMMQPPKRVVQAAIPRREYVFIVDISGSMHGYPLDISKKLLKDLIGGLRATDMFNVLLFAGGSQVLAERSLAATPENIQRALELIERQQGGGGTELLPAMQRALALPRTEGAARSLIIATDGFVTVEPEAFDLIRTHIGDASFFAFGIGTSVNRHLIEGMARMGAGEPFIIVKPDEAPGQAEKFRRYVQSPLLTRIRLDFGGFDAYDVEPSGVPDIFAERPAVVVGKWRGPPKGTIALTGLSGERKVRETLEVARAKPAEEHSALRTLWARSRIAQLSDYNRLQASDERIGQITDLGLRYSLLTAYTSFVAIDSQVRREGGEAATVKQALPLPEGVSDLAVGNAAPMAPRSMDRARGGTVAESEVPSLLMLKKSEKGEEAPLRISMEKVGGELPEAVVRKAVEPHLARWQPCVKGAEGSQEMLTLRWRVDARGAVRDVRVESTTGDRGGLFQCLIQEVTRLKFPAMKGSKEVVITLRIG